MHEKPIPMILPCKTVNFASSTAKMVVLFDRFFSTKTLVVKFRIKDNRNEYYNVKIICLKMHSSDCAF